MALAGGEGREGMLSVYLQSIGALLSPLMMLHTAQAKRQDEGRVCFVKYTGKGSKKGTYFLQSKAIYSHLDSNLMA